MFRTSVPVTAESFYNRDTELARLHDAVEKLRQGAPAWMAVMGSRKIGKTSLVMELARRTAHASLVFVALDVYEAAPLSPAVSRQYAIRTVDRAIGDRAGQSLEVAAREPAQYRRLLQSCDDFTRLPAGLRAEIQEVVSSPCNGPFIRSCLELPEWLAQALDMHIVVAIDEFEQFAALGSQRTGFDPFPLMRSVWQRHQRTSYIVSGSSRSMLNELLTAAHASFFQHFSLVELGPFSPDDAARLLVSQSPKTNRITKKLAKRGVEAIGGHPFYLQLLGETLVDQPHAPLSGAGARPATVLHVWRTHTDGAPIRELSVLTAPRRRARVSSCLRKNTAP